MGHIQKSSKVKCQTNTMNFNSTNKKMAFLMTFGKK